MWSTGVGFTLWLIIPVWGFLGQLSQEHRWNLVYFTSTVIILVCFSFLGGADASIWVWWCRLQPLLLCENRGAGRHVREKSRWSSLTRSFTAIMGGKMKNTRLVVTVVTVVPGNQIWMSLMSLIWTVWLPLLIIPFPVFNRRLMCLSETYMGMTQNIYHIFTT